VEERSVAATYTPTWVAEGAADGVAALEEELDDPRRDEAAGARHAHHLLRHASSSIPCRLPLSICLRRLTHALNTHTHTQRGEGEPEEGDRREKCARGGVGRRFNLSRFRFTHPAN
jgi:hypothetical protein